MLITKEYKKRSWLAKTFFCADTINYVPTLSQPCGRLSCAGHINAANNYREFGTGASFWSATESERDNTLAHFRYLFYIRAEMYGNTYGMGYGFSVQCSALRARLSLKTELGSVFFMMGLWDYGKGSVESWE